MRPSRSRQALCGGAHHLAQRRAQALDRRECGIDVVDAGRERTNRDLNQMARRKFEILHNGASGGDRYRFEHRLLEAGRGRLCRRHRCRDDAIDDVVPCAHPGEKFGRLSPRAAEQKPHTAREIDVRVQRDVGEPAGGTDHDERHGPKARSHRFPNRQQPVEDGLLRSSSCGPPRRRPATRGRLLLFRECDRASAPQCGPAEGYGSASAGTSSSGNVTCLTPRSSASSAM
jgi:hypothetical protein